LHTAGLNKTLVMVFWWIAAQVLAGLTVHGKAVKFCLLVLMGVPEVSFWSLMNDKM
jgi:hypothetical protein